MRIRRKTTGNTPTPQPNIADEDTKPSVSIAPVSSGEVQSIRASLSNTNQGSSDDESSDDGKKPKGVKRRNDLINFDVDIPKLIRHLD